MMRWIVGSSLRLQKIVLAVAIATIGLGAYQVTRAPADLLPEYQPPTVEVQTEALGLSAAEVEQLITVPLEQDLLVGVPFLDEISSVSLPGLSSVVMTFDEGTDVLDARQLVQERLTQAVGVAGLPAVAKTPQMIQPLSSNSRVAMVKLTADELSPIQMSVLARWVVTPRLLGVPGVANVAIWGNRERQLQVRVDPEVLRTRDVTLADVVRTSGNALEVSPLSYLEASKPGTGGFIDTPNQRLNIFHEQTITSARELSQVPVETADGGTVPGVSGPLTLGDVTEVVEDHQPLIGDTACATGGDCLLLVVEKFPHASAGQVADDLDAALTALAPGLGGIDIDSSLYRPADHVDAALTNTAWTLLAGGLLLLVVLLAAFRDWRRAVLSTVVVASSVGTALLVLALRGTTLNLLVLLGLTMGLTVLVAEAVTDAEGITERVRRHRASGTSAPVWGAIVDGTVWLRRSALFASLVLTAAVVPLFFLRDEGEAFVPPVVWSYLLALAVSFVVALLVTPALGQLLHSRPTGASPREALPALRRWYADRAARLVTATRAAGAVLGVLALAALVAAPFLDVSLRPGLKERDLVVSLDAPPGTSLPRMTALAEEAVAELGDVDGVTAANALVGRAVMSDRDVDVHRGEVWLAVDGSADYDATVRSVREVATGFSGVATEVTTYSDRRVEEILPPRTQDVTVRVFGEDPAVLGAKADEVRGAVRSVDGVSEVRVEQAPQEQSIRVSVDLQQAQRLGVKPGDVRRAAAMLVGGITVGNLFQEQKVFDVVVWGAPQIRDSVADVRRLLIDTPTGDTVRLGQVAEVTETPTDAVIAHQDVMRYVDVAADVSGRSVADAAEDIEAAVEGVSFPLDHHAEVLGDHDQARTALVTLLTIVLAAAVVAFLLLHSAFRSWRLAALVFCSLPLALVGGLAGAAATGGEVTLGVLAGLVAVLGLAARAFVTSVTDLLHLQRQNRLEWGPDLVARSTTDRFAPAVTTVLAVAALMLPVALAGGLAGLELVGPAAVAVLGGLVTTTIVDLFVLPALALRLGAGADVDSWIDDLYEPAPEMALQQH